MMDYPSSEQWLERHHGDYEDRRKAFHKRVQEHFNNATTTVICVELASWRSATQDTYAGIIIHEVKNTMTDLGWIVEVDENRIVHRNEIYWTCSIRLIPKESKDV